TGCIAQGTVFARGNLNRQAAQQFERALALAPGNPLAQLSLAGIYLRSPRTSDRALPLVAALKAQSDTMSDVPITPKDIFQLELLAYYVNHKQEDATRLLDATMSHRPPDTNLLEAAVQLCISGHQYTNGLAVVDKQLELSPNALSPLINRGFIQL